MLMLIQVVFALNLRTLLLLSISTQFSKSQQKKTSSVQT